MRVYSKNAMAQLLKITNHKAELLCSLRWPYQANVMNTLERNKRAIGKNGDRTTLIIHKRYQQKTARAIPVCDQGRSARVSQNETLSEKFIS